MQDINYSPNVIRVIMLRKMGSVGQEDVIGGKRNV